MANKVLYIKIARIDQNGNDQTNSLEALTQITLPYVNGTSKRYVVTSITREQNYFFYSLSLPTKPPPPPHTHSNNTLKYDFTRSLSTDLLTAATSPNAISQVNSTKIPISQSLIDNLNFFDSNSINYTFDTYSQKDIFVKATGSMNTSIIGAGTSLRLGIYVIPPSRINNPDEGGNPYLFATSSFIGTSDPNPSQFELEANIPKENIEPGSPIQLRAVAGFNITICKLLEGSRLFITSSNATGTSIETIPEPYLTSQFYGGDCDVLINNAELYRENPFLQDLDYSTNPNVPVNFNLVLNGTAARATVPESNYTFNNILNPNYSSVNSTTKYNVNASSFNSQTSGGVFVAYYKSSVTSGTPGMGYTTNVSLFYLITPDEEALEINNTEEMLNLLGTNFSVDANPLPSSEYPFGLPTGEIRVKATPLSGSDAGSALEYRGTSLIKGINPNLPSPFNISSPVTILQVKTSGSSSPGSNNSFGGIIYPASISLTSHADLPSKAREILTRNNIIAPSSTSP